MSHRSNSTQENPKHEPHPWLEEKVYVRLRQRTFDLVKRSVDALREGKQQDEVLTWRLRAEAAEARLKEDKRP